MDIKTKVSFVTDDQRSKLINLMQQELEEQGYEQAQIDEIMYIARDCRLCDLKQIIPLDEIKRIARIRE